MAIISLPNQRTPRNERGRMHENTVTQRNRENHKSRNGAAVRGAVRAPLNSKRGEHPIAQLRNEVLRWLYRHPRLLGLLLELRNAQNRILDVCRTPAWKRSAHLGPALWTDATGCLVPNERTRARIRDTQQLNQNLPWATVADHQLFLSGWDKGAEWAFQRIRSIGLCNGHTEQDMTFVSPCGASSIPIRETPESKAKE